MVLADWKAKMKLVSVAEMKSIENEADARGLTYALMMEHAGRGLAEIVQNVSIEHKERVVFGLVGPGNNGGDTLVALAHLAADGWRARAYLIKRTPDALVARLREAGGEVMLADEDDELASLAAFVESSAVLLDGVLGTGTKLPLKGLVAAVLRQTQAVLQEAVDCPYVIAVDCPSGVDSDSGEAASECLAADLTVTMAAVKQGLVRLPAYELIGELRVVDIGLPPGLTSLEAVHAEVAEADSIATILPARPNDAHKGTFGTALIAAGSVNYTGAASLAGKAAYRVGAGLVTLAVPASLHPILAGEFPEATWVLLPQALGVISRDAADVLISNLDRATALLIGPGIGLEESTREFMVRLLSTKSVGRNPTGRIGFLQGDSGEAKRTSDILPPLVLDADALKLVAKVKDWPNLLPAPAVLTPHPGEMAALTGMAIGEIQQNRRVIAEKFAREWGHVVVLKGAFTIVAAPDGQTTLIPVASAALARAGTGDVLAGLIVGLRAQGAEAYEAAVAGAWIHAQAGLFAARKLGTTASVLAGDVLASVSDVLSDLGGNFEAAD
jgi:NAD(P)H-hydrate epimerase